MAQTWDREVAVSSLTGVLVYPTKRPDAAETDDLDVNHKPKQRTKSVCIFCDSSFDNSLHVDFFSIFSNHAYFITKI